VPTVPTDPVQPGASLARAASPQAGAPSSGETSPFEALLGTGHSPPSQTSTKPAHPYRAAASGQSTVPTPPTPLHPSLSAPGTPSPPLPINNDASERTGVVGDSHQSFRVAADATGVATANLPVQVLTDPAGASANTTGEPIAAGRASSPSDDPTPGTATRKSDKASATDGDANTVLATSGSIGSVTQQMAGPTMIASPAVTPAPTPAPATASASPAPAAALQPATVAAVAAAAAAAGGAAAAPAPNSGAAPGSSTATPTPPAPQPTAGPLDPTALPIDPTALVLEQTAAAPQAGPLGGAAVEPAPAESAGEKTGNGPGGSGDAAGVKPMGALANAPAPAAVSGTSGEPVQSANTQVRIADAAALPANGANHVDVTTAGGTHVDPPGDGPASPAEAAAPSGSALAQSAAPALSANSPVPATVAAVTAAPLGSVPSSPAAVPISGLAVEIAARVTRDEKSFQIRLDPPELGRIDVQLNVDASGHVTTRLTADRPETLNLLRQDASSLQRALESTGLKAGSGGLEFSLRNQSFGGEAGGQRGGRSNGSPSPVARIIVPDEGLPAGQTATRGYARLLGGGAGVDIRV
jgi:flagellar hook-length control protein FliK